jgi:hypothetical protein
MEKDSKGSATKEDLHMLSCKLEWTQIAMGCILSSLSKRVDLDAIFDEAFETSREVSEALNDDEGTIYVGQIIEHIKACAKMARKAPLSPELPREHQGCDERGYPLDPNHHWNKETS